MTTPPREAEADTDAPPPAAGPGTGPPPRRPRRMTDARALRAFAHPTRIALVEAVALEGPLTATEAARIVGGTVANLSYHLRTLARDGYVVEADSRDGRERPWRLGDVVMELDRDDPDPGVGRAAEALSRLVMERWLTRHRHYENHRDSYDEPVREASGSGHYVLFATPEETRRARAEINAVLMRYAHRLEDATARPPGTVAFEVYFAAHPFGTPGPAGPDI